MSAPAKVEAPEWALGWNPNNPGAQKIAVARFSMPVTTPEERAAARAFTPAPTHHCAGCGRHHFATPMLCFWCRRASTPRAAGAAKETRCPH